MKPEQVYIPKFNTHDLSRYGTMRNEVMDHIEKHGHHQISIALGTLSEQEIRIYIQHIIQPLIYNMDTIKIHYHLIVSVGRLGENKMTVLRKELKKYFIQFRQDTRRQISIYG